LAAVELYGAEGSGSIAVEAALTLLQLPYTLIEGATWAHESARERIAPVNAMRQVPTLILPDGEMMTESAAILIYPIVGYIRAAEIPNASRGTGNVLIDCRPGLEPGTCGLTERRAARQILASAHSVARLRRGIFSMRIRVFQPCTLPSVDRIEPTVSPGQRCRTSQVRRFMRY